VGAALDWLLPLLAAGVAGLNLDEFKSTSAKTASVWQKS